MLFMIRKLFTLPFFLTLLGLCTAANTHAVSITAATGGANLSADLAQNATAHHADVHHLSGISF
jgi:hypothetical protein